MACIAVLLLLVVPVSADWLSGWQYRKSHVINNTGGALSDYQVKFTVHRSDGSDSGDDVYIGSSGCESDYDDIRFTKSDGTTLLDYWIEESDENSATIWVEVDTIAASGNTTIYLYYGNAGASAVSNGANTFLQFHGAANANFHDSNDIPAPPVIFEAKVRNTYASPEYLMWGLGETGDLDVSPSADAISIMTYGAGNMMYLKSFNDGTQTPANEAPHFTKDQWYRLKIIVVGSGNAHGYVDENEIASGISTANVPNEPMGLAMQLKTGTGEQEFSFARKYAATEPTHGAWGSSEESLYEITADFSGVPTSGIVPLTVYFADNSSSTGNETVTIDTWSWDFGDESSASTDQNPAHQYTTSGTYTVALTASNATYGTTDTETKTDYITVNIDSAAPTADFVATPLCEDVGDPIYFIDYSTGGGLYAWNWSFGDGNYSELRNPTHTYASNGTYDISLTVWGANGTDTLTKTGYITIPCGAPTPTPTVTPTPTGTIPVQGDVDAGRISPLGFVMLAFINLGLVLHTFVNNESRNYLHVFTGIVAVIVSFMLGMFLITGFVQEDFVVTAAEVTVNSSVLSTYQVEQVSIIDAGVGYYFVFIGILMALIVILSVIEIIREIQEG